VRLTQLDLPNLALMRLASFRKARGDHMVLSRAPHRSPAEPDHDRVYGSAIFSYTAARVARLKAELGRPVAASFSCCMNMASIRRLTRS
jgi:hypothetical protein